MSEPSPKSPEPPRKAVVVAFASGKGGVGKTSLCLAVAKLLSEMGSSVLLVDLDFGTHGAAYFFVEEMRASLHRGIIDLAIEAQEKRLGHAPVLTPVLVKDGFDFVASKSNFSTRSASLTEWAGVRQSLGTLLLEARQKYDFVVLDTQAGTGWPAGFAAKRADKLVLVSEPDPISVSALRALEYEIKDSFPSQTFYVLNSLFLEEAKVYEILADYLQMLWHLPPIPFDFRVRKAFLRRQNPLDVGEPSPFFFGLIRCVAVLLPDISERLKQFAEQKLGEVVTPVERHIEQLEVKIQGLGEQYRELASQRDAQDRARRFFWFQLVALATAGLVFSTLVFGDMLPVTNERSVVAKLLLALLTLSGALIASYYWLAWVRERRVRGIGEKESELLRVMARLEGERAQYQTLLLDKKQQFGIERTSQEPQM